MRTKLLIILFTLFFAQSYSQDFVRIKVDAKLQTKYSDTLKNIEERLNGKWKYLGIKNNGTLCDTLFTSFSKRQKKIVIVENGIIYELKNRKKSEVDYYYEITFDFNDGSGFYTENTRKFKSDIINIATCQPIPELIFYKGKIGILFIGMGGQSFSELIELTSKKLIMENGKEYLKLE